MFDKLIKKMKWYDISLIKLATFFATLFLITAWPAFNDFVMGFDWYYYLILMVVVMIPLLIKMFSGSGEPGLAEVPVEKV
jgi:hypothetical protein